MRVETPKKKKVAYTVPLDEVNRKKFPRNHLFLDFFCRMGYTVKKISLMQTILFDGEHTMKHFFIADIFF